MIDFTGYSIKQFLFAGWSIEHTALFPNASQLKNNQKPKNQNYKSIFPSNSFDLLKPVKEWFDHLEVHDRMLAHRICHLIPAQCPFERDIKFMGKTLIHIPPLCKLNPLYNEFVGLRFRALCYLADECGEDISAYC